MTDWLALDRFAIEEAERLAASQPLCYSYGGGLTFEQLPTAGAVNPTDLFCIERNGTNYSVPASLIPTEIIGTIGFFNVQTYGAVPDGTTINDTFVAAAIAAAAVNGGIVYFPQGNYLKSAGYTWNLPQGVSVWGAGSGASKITTAAGSVAAPVFSSATAASYITIQGLGFFGNAVNPAPPPNAATVIVFNGGVQNRVTGCYFQGNTGDCIDFLGVTGGSVDNCYFYGTGYNGAGTSNTLVTPCVFADSASISIKIHHNEFQSPKYFGILILGTNCEASFNYLKNSGSAAIRVGQVSSSGLGNGYRVVGNEVDTVKHNPIDSLGGNGIYTEGCVTGICTNNIVYECDADGIVLAKPAQTITNNNIIFNCCQASNEAGIQLNPQSGGTNVGNVVNGNVSFDNQATPTQLCGLRVLGPGSGGLSYTTIVGNSFNGFTGSVGGNPQGGIIANDSVLDGDTNIVEANTDWLDRQHLGSNSTSVASSITATGVGAPLTSVLGNLSIGMGVMGLNRAITLRAYGVVTVVTSVTFLLSYGTALGNIINFAETTPHAGVMWSIELNMNSADDNNTQHFSYRLYYNGVLTNTGVGNLFVSTSTQANPLVLQATTGTGDSITCDAYTLLRE